MLFYAGLCTAQHKTKIIATLDSTAKTLQVTQEIELYNNSNSVWNDVYLLDWANAFSSVETPLADRFAEDFKNKFEFARNENRGRTNLSAETLSNPLFKINRLSRQQDILQVILSQPLLPGEKRSLPFKYTIEIPLDDYTGYGRSKTNEYNLRHWYLAPAVFKNGAWSYYSNKNLHDFYAAPMDFNISLHVPAVYKVISNLTETLAGETSQRNSYLLEGKAQKEVRLHVVNKENDFNKYATVSINVTTDIDDPDLPLAFKLIFIDRITTFLQEKIGDYPHDNLLVTERFYKESPVYGLSSLPKFINPFPAGYTHEIKLLKAITRNWVAALNKTNPRDDGWLQQATIVYLLMQYQEQYYPNLKISGKLGNILGIRGFYASQLEFNDQYNLLYLNAARLNIDQAINTPVDSLIKYNEQLATPNKGGLGLRYLNDYLGDNSLEKSLRDFYQVENKYTDPLDLKIILNQETTKTVDWFFDDYITSHKFMEWKIKSVKRGADSLEVTIKNKSDRKLPVPLYLLENDSIVLKQWVDGSQKEVTVTLPRKRATQLALNYENLIPEFTMRDNYKTLKKFPSLNRPIEFRLFKDIENPKKTQIFLMPDISYNLYDGISAGGRFYNGNLIRKPFSYSIRPNYGLTSGKLVGAISLAYEHPLQDRDERLYEVRYGASATTFSYDDDLLYRRGSVFLNLSFRPKDLRSNAVQQLNIRNITVSRDRDPANPVSEPDYNVFNITYGSSDLNLKRFKSYGGGLEVSNNFTKVDFRTQWRRLYNDNRQLSVRLFAGAFLTNNSQASGDFFSFALDRPTDYLFDYNYYGRSESSGLFSQQFIPAEGGFKSRLEPAFANQWLATVNSSYSIWKYIFVYGDVGFVKNRLTDPVFVYDSGVRLNLLQDYFELYFPVYSNNGWEMGQARYDQKIRFIVTLDINTAIRLFNRRWY